MFTDFLYLLRSYGMKTSLNEWNSLMDALEMNLNDASLTEFYYMARAVLVKKESEYDKFDQAFLAYFKNVQTFEELPKEVLDWLAKAHAQTPYDKDEVDARFAGLDLDDIRKMMAERLKEQHEQHHGGNKWIGTGGTSAFGHSGYSPKGIRVADRAKTGARCRWRNSGIIAISATMRSSRSGSFRWRSKSCVFYLAVRMDRKRNSMWRKRSRRPVTKVDVWSSSWSARERTRRSFCF